MIYCHSVDYFLVFNNQFTLGDIINALLLIVTLVTLFISIRQSRKALELDFRPYIDVNPLPIQPIPRTAHHDGLVVTVYNRPLQVKLLTIYLTTWKSDGTICQQKEIQGIENQIGMPDAASMRYAFNINILQWFSQQQNQAAPLELTMLVIVSYTLLGGKKTYLLQRNWTYNNSDWKPTKIIAT